MLSHSYTDIILNNSIVFYNHLLKVFVHVSRCLIYKVHRCVRSLLKKLFHRFIRFCPPLWRIFYIVASGMGFVKNFFRLFSSFFSLTGPFRICLNILARNCRFVNTFFRFFSKIFDFQPIVGKSEERPKILCFRSQSTRPGGRRSARGRSRRRQSSAARTSASRRGPARATAPG